MASDVMSLFGLNPNTIQQNRLRDAGDSAARMNPYYAAGRAGGMLMGAGAGSALGLQTAEMKEASNVKSALQGVDLETPEGLRQAAKQLSVNGDYARAMALTASANQLEAEQLSVTQSAEDRALGVPSTIIVKPATQADDTGFGKKAAVTHTIVTYPDGSVFNYTTGKKYASVQTMMEAVKTNQSVSKDDPLGDTQLVFTNGKLVPTGNPVATGESDGTGSSGGFDASGGSSDSGGSSFSFPDKLNKAQEDLARVNSLIEEVGKTTPELDNLLKTAEDKVAEVREQDVVDKTKQVSNISEAIQRQQEIIRSIVRKNSKGELVIVDTPMTNQARIKLETLLKSYKSLTGEEYLSEES